MSDEEAERAMEALDAAMDKAGDVLDASETGKKKKKNASEDAAETPAESAAAPPPAAPTTEPNTAEGEA